MPCIECVFEFLLPHILEPKCKQAQFSGRFGLRLPRQICRHGLHLMKLAILHWYLESLKYLRHTSLSVDDGTGDVPSGLAERNEPISIYERCFKLRLHPPEILFQGWRTKDDDTISASPESHVSNDWGWLRRKQLGAFQCRVKMFLHPLRASSFALSELSECLTLPDIRIKQRTLFARMLPC